jgi:uncharacterized repeat protein (TIGR03803 family)
VTAQQLKSFGFFNLSGGSPSSLVVGTDGALYGATLRGGYNSAGTVFRLNPDGTGYNVLHGFGAGGDGANPGSLLQGADGNLYGVTAGGGTNGAGTVYTLRTDGSGYALLYQFNYLTDGAGGPQALAQGADGLLYGTAVSGGTNSVGSVFRLSTNGTGYTVLHSFSYAGGDGQSPAGALALSREGVLYGTTSRGGSYSLGTVFELGTDGTGYAVLYNLTDGSGSANQAGLVLGSAGVLYGTTYSGGASNFGTIFRLGTDGTGYTNLHDFTATLGDGAGPSVPLVLGPDGFLYGATGWGGSLYSAGTVFKVNTNGTGYQVLYRFAVNYGSQDGQSPTALALSSAGVLYGTTLMGGSTSEGYYSVRGDGTLFALGTNGGNYPVSYPVIYNFNSGGGDGASPYAPLVAGRDGALYGTTRDGGNQQKGALFQLNPNGTGYSVLYSMGISAVDGKHPLSALVQGMDGAFYGTASEGGYSQDGTVFKLNPDGTGDTLLHGFGFLAGGDGQNPIGLLQGTDGALYGVTQFGGNSSRGTVFKIDTNGANYRIICEFTNGVTGAGPQAGLVQGIDGFLYGTTYYGGSNGLGVVFKLSTDGADYTVLHDFGTDPLDTFGSPSAPLVQGADGMLYGTTAGSIFKVSTNGTGYAVLHGFGGYGQSPNGLVQGADGALYGTTLYGGSYGNTSQNQGDGTLFKINTDGTGYIILYSFGGYPNDGINPQAGLVRGSDGAFYGTTSGGGSSGVGTVFRYGPTLLQFTGLTQLSNGMVQLALTGATNTTCRIDASSDLVNWVTLTNIPDTSGAIEFLDQSAAGFPMRFYRGLQMQ